MFPLIPPRDEPPEPGADDVAEDFSDEREPTWEEELEAAGSPDDLIVVNTYRYAHEAELAKTQLAEKGITANVADNDRFDFFGNLVRDAKLLVLRSQARQAVAILTEQPSPPVSEDEASDRARTVRANGSENQARRHREPAAPENSEIDEAPEIVQCLACGAVLADNQARCPACGWSYRDDGEDEQRWAITVR